MNFRKPQQVRLVIADDHPIFRDGLRRLLEAEADLKVLGEASDGAEAVKLAKQLKPDILLLDLAMPKHPGLEALRDLSLPANATPVRVILLTAAAEKSQIVEALQLGARGVVLKDSATQLAAQGDSYGDGGRVLGGARERFEPGAVFADADAVVARRGAAEEVRAHAARVGDCFRGGRGILEQGNRGVFQDQ